jgi:hypothetical protein
MTIWVMQPDHQGTWVLRDGDLELAKARNHSVPGRFRIHLGTKRLVVDFPREDGPGFVVTDERSGAEVVSGSRAPDSPGGGAGRWHVTHASGPPLAWVGLGPRLHAFFDARNQPVVSIDADHGLVHVDVVAATGCMPASNVPLFAVLGMLLATR